jgi:hypothetical protein
MLYVAEMARNSGLLLYLLTSERLRNLQLPHVTCNES